VVAINDGGIVDIPALRAALWRNPAEQFNGKDDDGDGYVDDLFGYDFANQSGYVLDAGRLNHGTICAGIVAGRPVPGKPLVTGVAPRARLMLLNGMGYLKSYEYALAHGADVLSMSYTWVNMELGQYRGVFRTAAEHLSAAGVLPVGGAGNFAKTAARGAQICLPKDVPCVVAVAGVQEDGKRPPFSSQGPCFWNGVRFYDDYPPDKPLRKPDLSAPAGGFPCWIKAGTEQPQWKTVWKGEDSDALVTGPAGNSFAGPHAAGVAALVFSANPELNAWQVKRILEETCQRLGAEPDYDHGAGLLQALPAVLAAKKSGRAAAGGAVPAIDVSRARQYFGEARALAQKDAGKLWGQSLAGPLLFADRKSRQVVANQRDAEGLLQPDGDVFVGRLPDRQPIANTTVTWVGVKWTMVGWPPYEDATERGALLMHESWHRIQDQLGLPASGPANKHLDTMDGRLWVQLEWRALAAALSADGDRRRSAIEDALAFRAHRRGLFKTAAEEERSLEMHEGLAEYTGVRLCGLAERDLPAVVVRKLERRPAEMPTFVRSFAYLSGPAYGLLLEAARPDWRKGLKPSDDFGQLLQQALVIDVAPQPANVLESRAGRYQGAKLRAAEQARDEQRKKLLTENRARFVEGPVLSVPLRQMQMSFDPNTLQPLGELGTVYPTIRISDVWGVLAVSKGALVWSDYSKVHVVAPSDPQSRSLAGDGWTLELKDGWKLESGKRKGDFVVTQSKP
jgi:hypothetical protein